VSAAAGTFRIALDAAGSDKRAGRASASILEARDRQRQRDAARPIIDVVVGNDRAVHALARLMPKARMKPPMTLESFFAAIVSSCGARETASLVMSSSTRLRGSLRRRGSPWSIDELTAA